LKINDSEKLDIKNLEFEFCLRGRHAFHALENYGLINLLQQFVTLLLAVTVEAIELIKSSVKSD